MPSYPPRTDTTKKQDLLLKREIELRKVIDNREAGEKLELAIRKYREANLSLLKAKLHVIREKEFQNKAQDFNLSNIENEIETWINKQDEQIINDLK